MERTVVLIDADVLLYRAGFASQRTFHRFVKLDGVKIDFHEMSLSEVKEKLAEINLTKANGSLYKCIKPQPESYARQVLFSMINRIVKMCPADEYRYYVSDNETLNFRLKVAVTQPYKGNRVAKRPAHYEFLRNLVIDTYAPIILPCVEGDDAIGIDACAIKDKTIIASIDKDLDMLPGWHFNLVSEKLYFTEDPGELYLTKNRKKVFGGGLKWFYAQMLLGDTSDHIPGVPGYGPVKAYGALQPLKNEQEFFEEVYSIYQDKSISHRFLEVADLLWIQRATDEFKSTELQLMLADFKRSKKYNV